jgi:pyruvate dehydrogenase E2 component (dihydrolipoyllysine-residue acetyltransferase)
MQTHTVKVPDIGDYQGVDVVEVHVSPGDEVGVDDAVVTLESDKATLDIPTPAAGKVAEVFVKVGDKVSEGDPLLSLMAAGAETGPEPSTASHLPSASAPTPPPSATPDPASAPVSAPVSAPAPAPEPTPQNAPTSGASVPHASPGVRRLAREVSVDLSTVAGSGRKGRIRAEDVLAAAQAGAGGAVRGGGVAWPAVVEGDYASFGEVEEVPLSRVRQKGVARLHASWANVPHVTQHGEADVTDLEAFRRSLKDEASGADVRLTSMAFLMRACVSALMEYPDFNSSLTPAADALIRKRYYNLGIAVDTDDGLVVPVVRGVDRKGVMALARELTEVGERARKRRLKPGDVQGATFTISNLGSIGGTAFTPIVNAPEVAILGVSRSATRPVWDGEGFVPRTLLPLSLSYDHRAIDGAAAARFVTYLARTLSDPRRLVL